MKDLLKNKRTEINTICTADNRAVIQGDYYRITVLTPCMIRLEYSKQGCFVDIPSQMVTNRSFPVPDFRTEESGEELVVITDALRLQYDKKEFSANGLEISLRGQFGPYSTKWCYGEEPKDLLGTARTLDATDGKVPLEHGILSLQGFSLLDDSKTLLLDETGWICQRPDAEAVDLYFLGYGHDYLTCLRDYHILTGKVPLLPKFALGNWWSRYYAYTQEEYLNLMERFEQEDVPFTVSVLDMDWHLTEIDPGFGTGWTGYTWNKELFPDPEGFLCTLHKRGLKVTLNLHPADGVRSYEDCYEQFAKYMGVNTEQRDPIRFEPGSRKFMDGFFAYVSRPLEKQGVDFWWIDWQQGTRSSVEGLDPLWMLNHYYYLDSKKAQGRGLIFSRYAGPGSHRYPVGFSGDSIISWNSLDFQPYFTANASNIGYGWWSHDIGGHMGGIRDDELATRWLQFGVFSPINRLHSSNSVFNSKEPWRFNRISEMVMKKFLRLRHRMIPYLYTMNLRACRDSIPLIQPMYYQNPDQFEAYAVPNEYYFGSELVVCPITRPVNPRTGNGIFEGWLPEGIWADIFTGMMYDGNRRMDLYRTIEQIPVLLKPGGIFTMDGRTDGNNLDNPDSLEILVNPFGDGTFLLWEDNGEGSEDGQENWVRTKITTQTGETTIFEIHAAEGDTDLLPQRRAYEILFYGVTEETSAEILLDGENFTEAESWYEKSRGIRHVHIPKVGIKQNIRILLRSIKRHTNQKEDRIFNFLNTAQIPFEKKETIFRIVSSEKGNTNLVFVIGQLMLQKDCNEMIGPLMEILTSCD